LKNIIQKHPLWSFFILACALSWPTGYVGLSNFESVPGFVTTFLNYFAKFGPSLAGLIVIYTIHGASGLKKTFASLTDIRVAPKWYAVALLSPLALWGIAVAIMIAQGNEVSVEIGAWYVLFVYIAKHFFLGGGLGEELGWRGLMLPMLQAKRSALSSSLILGFAWGLWHAPKFFVGDGGGFGSMIPFLVYTIVLAIIFTALYNSSGGNLLIVTLFHAAMNASNGFIIKLLPAIDTIESSEIYVALLWLATAVLLTIVFGPRKLSRSEKVVDASA
jgi:membrane protease YdiL (CAAX protease family)